MACAQLCVRNLCHNSLSSLAKGTIVEGSISGTLSVKDLIPFTTIDQALADVMDAINDTSFPVITATVQGGSADRVRPEEAKICLTAVSITNRPPTPNADDPSTNKFCFCCPLSQRCC